MGVCDCVVVFDGMMSRFDASTDEHVSDRAYEDVALQQVPTHTIEESLSQREDSLPGLVPVPRERFPLPSSSSSPPSSLSSSLSSSLPPRSPSSAPVVVSSSSSVVMAPMAAVVANEPVRPVEENVDVDLDVRPVSPSTCHRIQSRIETCSCLVCRVVTCPLAGLWYWTLGV